MNRFGPCCRYFGQMRWTRNGETWVEMLAADRLSSPVLGLLYQGVVRLPL